MAEPVLEYSTIACLVYFLVNIIFLIILATVVYRQGAYKVATKDGKKFHYQHFFKDVWSQRKIYAPLIIHFYDTATDIGVIYSWFILMELESDPNTNFESVDMAIFFWIGIAFIILYRVCIFMLVVYNWLCDDYGEWYLVILSLLCLFDLFIFIAVYESFSEAQGIITKNAAKRERNRQIKEQKRKQKQMERTVELAEAGKNVEEIKQILQEEEEQELEPGQLQFFMQLGESVVEAMPQIVLQSVFIIRSGNDPELVKESNIWLVLLSVIASLFSIASKFIFLDKDSFHKKAKSLKLSPNCPRCINYWYICRVIWRMSHIAARFNVFVLMWTVLGGRWLPMFLFLSWVSWTIYLCWWQTHDSDARTRDAVLSSIVYIVGIVVEDGKFRHWYIIRIVEHMFAMAVITLFAASMFECQFNFCSEADDRQLIDNDNERVLIFWSLGWLSLIVEALLFAVMYFNGVFASDTYFFNEHGKYLTTIGKQNQTLIMDKSKMKSDDPDYDTPNSAYLGQRHAFGFNMNTDAEYRIKIKNLPTKDDNDIQIGAITDVSDDFITNECFIKDDKARFCAYSSSGKFITKMKVPVEVDEEAGIDDEETFNEESEDKGTGYCEGDIVTMKWQGQKKVLQFFVNEKEQCSFTPSNLSEDYFYPVVSLKNHGDSISVIYAD